LEACVLVFVSLGPQNWVSGIDGESCPFSEAAVDGCIIRKWLVRIILLIKNVYYS